MTEYHTAISFTKVKLPYGWLGNMSPYPITFQGYVWDTAEALFQAMRFDDEGVRDEIWRQNSPMAAKMIAKKHRDNMVIEPRSEQDVENMGLVLMLKIEQHAEIRRMLLETGDAEIIEDCTRRASESGLFWGAKLEGGEWKGENKLGKLWRELRAEVRRGDW